jgi:hypothetical protein
MPLVSQSVVAWRWWAEYPNDQPARGLMDQDALGATILHFARAESRTRGSWVTRSPASPPLRGTSELVNFGMQPTAFGRD